MKITKSQLKQIIKEELGKVLNEEYLSAEKIDKKLHNLVTELEEAMKALPENYPEDLKKGLENNRAYLLVKIIDRLHRTGPYRQDLPGDLRPSNDEIQDRLAEVVDSVQDILVHRAGVHSLTSWLENVKMLIGELGG